jgi:UDP-N-acetylglucosamine--N-acetylmuramyl-(pentapeptide) pyrophosphoryl-undecaprenol N-acetylglucosamine transferase
MDYLLSISDLVVARAGATSISEICYMGVPAVLIPYKWSAEDHQKHNAEFVVNGGGGVMIEEDNLTPNGLAEIILSLKNDKNLLKSMKKNIQELFPKDVTKQIVDKIGEICGIK